MLLIISYAVYQQLYPAKSEIVTITKKEPGKIIYLPGPQPTPEIIEKIIYTEKIIYKDGVPYIEGLLSFKQDLHYLGKRITTESVDMTFDGVYHVSMLNNLLSVKDEILGDIETKISYKTKPQLMNEGGPFYGTLTGPGLYYRRYLKPISIVRPWLEVDISKNPEIRIGLPFKF